MSVTAKPGSGGAAGSRNAVIVAEWEAEQARQAEWDSQHPEDAALVAALCGGGSEDERRARNLVHWFQHASYWCSRCRSEFAEGDVVYRKRGPTGKMAVLGASWKLEAICDDCVRNRLRPSWWEHRRTPVPCAGGCGVLVSHWYCPRARHVRRNGYSFDVVEVPAISTCSKRCSDRVEVERRRVEHQPRRCEICDEEFTPKRSDARFCSNACRQDAYRQRKAGRL
jgi:hypothetical protein